MTPETLTSLINATWPAKSLRDVDGWTIREGAGGGSRVSAATATTGASLEQHSVAANAMRKLGQTPLFMVRAGEDELDALLERDGYVIKDPVTYYTAPTKVLAKQRPPAVTCFEVWPPLAAQAEIWAQGGIDTARFAIMDRVNGTKTTILGRLNDTPAGTAFAAIHDGTAMLHAIETAVTHRRKGLGRHMLTAMSFWAQDQGADTVALLVTRANVAANALYASLGMTPVGGYHYRNKPEI